MFNFVPQILFRTFFAPINIFRFTLDILEEKYVFNRLGSEVSVIVV